MPLPMLTLMLAGVPVPDNKKGLELFHTCQAALRIQDKTSTNELADASESLSCVAYIDGFTDGVIIFDRKGVCLDGVGFETIVRVYVAYMKEHPKDLENFESIGLYGSLKEAFPCVAK